MVVSSPGEFNEARAKRDWAAWMLSEAMLLGTENWRRLQSETSKIVFRLIEEESAETRRLAQQQQQPPPFLQAAIPYQPGPHASPYPVVAGTSGHQGTFIAPSQPPTYQMVYVSPSKDWSSYPPGHGRVQATRVTQCSTPTPSPAAVGSTSLNISGLSGFLGTWPQPHR